jgi:uncharacterized protein (TIGR03435 family)
MKANMWRPLGPWVICTMACAIGWAQTPVTRPVFAVASVKPNASGEEIGRMRVTAGRFVATNVTVRALIALAFGNGRNLFGDQIVGMRDLRTAAEPLRRLLEDRFGLKTHAEKQQQSVYALVRLTSDNHFGPGFQPSSVDCTDPAVRARAATAPANGRSICGAKFGDGSIEVGGYSVRSLIYSLSTIVGRIVVDETGLSGLFDITLHWNPTLDGSVVTADDRPSIFSAVQEQLGLKLEPRRVPVDVVIVDGAERPTPD